MEQLPVQVEQYLATQRIGVLAVELLDGSPHAATVHFAHTAEPLAFYYETARASRKAEPMLRQAETRASFVVGTSEDEMKTVQLDGVVRIISPIERPQFDQIYLSKFPEKRGKADEAKVLFVTFIPTWWRFTDWHTSTGKLIISSIDEQ